MLLLPFYISAKGLKQPCVVIMCNTFETVLAFLCSNVKVISFITFKNLYTDHKSSKGRDFALPTPTTPVVGVVPNVY